jgi:DNA invertase Pin-like site-specific DNA recombinase
MMTTEALPVRAVIYARISNDPTGQAAGVTRQVEACAHLGAAREWQFTADPLVDNDISAFNGARRPAYERLLHMIRDGEVDAVITWHMDRMCRRVADLVELLKLAVGDGKRPGVKIATVHGDLDLSSPVGRMFATILIAVAEYEAAHKGERQQAAEHRNAKNGKRRTAAPRAFGYEPDHVTKRPGEAGAIEWAASALLGGASVSAVMREWNRRGLRPSQAPFGPLDEHPWTRNSVTTVLRNPRIAGLPAYKGEVFDGVMGQWDAILPEEQWRAVDALLASSDRTITFTRQGETVTRRINAHAPRGVKSMLGGLAVCPCGNVVEHGVNHRGQAVYRCRPATRSGRPGPHVAVKAEPVDEYVERVVVNVLSADDLTDLVTPPPHVDTAGLRAEAAAIRRNLDEMGADRALGLVSRSQMLAATERGNARLAEIGADLAEAAGAGALAPFARGEAAKAVWGGLDLSRRREVIRTLGTVTLLPAGRGARAFDARKVRIESVGGDDLAA